MPLDAAQLCCSGGQCCPQLPARNPQASVCGLTPQRPENILPRELSSFCTRVCGCAVCFWRCPGPMWAVSSLLPVWVEGRAAPDGPPKSRGSRGAPLRPVPLSPPPAPRPLLEMVSNGEFLPGCPCFRSFPVSLGHCGLVAGHPHSLPPGPSADWVTQGLGRRRRRKGARGCDPGADGETAASCAVSPPPLLQPEAHPPPRLQGAPRSHVGKRGPPAGLSPATPLVLTSGAQPEEATVVGGSGRSGQPSGFFSRVSKSDLFWFVFCFGGHTQ